MEGVLERWLCNNNGSRHHHLMRKLNTQKKKEKLFLEKMILNLLFSGKEAWSRQHHHHNHPRFLQQVVFAERFPVLFHLQVSRETKVSKFFLSLLVF